MTSRDDATRAAVAPMLADLRSDLLVMPSEHIVEQHLDMMAFEAFVSARLPSVRCPEHGDVALTPSWASDHVSLRDLIRNGNADQLRDTRAERSSRRAHTPGSPGRTRR